MLLIFQLSPQLVGLLFVCRTLIALVPSLQILVVKKLIDSVATLLSGGSGMQGAIHWLAAETGLLLLSTTLEAANQYITLLLKQKTQHRMEAMLVNKSLKIPLSRFEQPQYYDLLQRSKTNISYRSYQLIEQFFMIGQSLLTLTSLVVVLWQFNWLLSVAMLLIVIPTLLVNTRIGEWKYWLNQVQTPFSRRLHYFFDLLTNRLSAKEIKLFQHADKLQEYWRTYYWKNAGEQKKVELRAQAMRTCLEGVSGLLGFLFSCHAIWICYQQKLSLGAYVAIAQVLMTTQASLRMVAQGLSSIYEESMVITDFYSLIDEKEESEGQGRVPFGAPVQEGIVVNGLSFSYPSGTKPVLRDISFEILPNQKVAIVGENGAGKSTLVNCLIGMYLEYEGSIRYDGIELREMDIASLRKKVSAVFQDFLRYQVSVKENIAYGDIKRLNDDAAIEVAAARSGASDFAKTLSQGMDTLLGPVFEGGQELSVGQWQKLALARSFLRDSAIIVLDEPTASMDPMSEAELFRRFSELSHGRIALLVSHRLSSCRMADHILVLKDGMLVEQGSHNELLLRRGEYFRMYETQSITYR